jgi:3-methyladenine DNA glycosylase AlkD
MAAKGSKTKVAKFHRAIRSALKPLKNPERAAAMRAYMRDKFVYLGVGTPEHRVAVAPLIRAFDPASAAELRSAATGLWAMREREYQYVAVGLLGRYHAVLSIDDLPWLLDLAQQKSWWDTVDSLVKVVGKIVQRSGAKGVRAMDRAIGHKDF